MINCYYSLDVSGQASIIQKALGLWWASLDQVQIRLVLQNRNQPCPCSHLPTVLDPTESFQHSLSNFLIFYISFPSLVIVKRIRYSCHMYEIVYDITSYLWSKILINKSCTNTLKIKLELNFKTKGKFSKVAMNLMLVK